MSNERIKREECARVDGMKRMMECCGGRRMEEGWDGSARKEKSGNKKTKRPKRDIPFAPQTHKLTHCAHSALCTMTPSPSLSVPLSLPLFALSCLVLLSDTYLGNPGTGIRPGYVCAQYATLTSSQSQSVLLVSSPRGITPKHTA